MRHIGDQIKNETSLLRYSDSMLAQLSSDASQGPFQSLADPSEAATVRTVMTERFTNGYSLVRHRTAPGQVTAAFTRSPLAPVIVPRPDALPAFSNNGQDYQILDPRIGIMDISYSTAFQFGKTLASADMGFVAALMRIRGNVHSAGAAAADTAVADPAVTSTTKMAVMNDLPTVAGNIVQLSKGSTRANTPTLKGRWRQARKPVAKTIRDVNDPAWKNAYVAGVRDRMTVLASASHLKDTGTPNARIPSFAQPSTTVEATTDSTVPYNDLTSPISTDWAFLFNWIMDKLFLDTIPVHYLITDPAHLPTESIRFFHIDPTWLDCMIDGALSVANHLSNDDDVIRQFIKVEINRYLSTPIGSGPTAHLPQVPLYGFFLRSAVVKVFPDLQLTIPYPDVEGVGLAPILVQKRMASDILMVLLDRLPDGGQISSIRFTQPMHQQCFSAGDSLDDNAIEFLFRKIYRTTASQAAAHDALHEFGKPHSWSRTDTSSNAYDWTSRCLNFAKVEEALFRSTDGLVAAMPTEWGPPVQPLLTSSMAGVQLNDTVKYLEIRPAQNIVTSPPGIALPRQIYAGSTSTISTTLRESSRPSTAKLLASSSIKTGASSLQTQSALPVVTQQLPKPLLRSSAKIQPRSLTKTPPQLNTITGPNAVPKMAPDPGSSSSSSKASGAGIMPGAQGLGNVGVGSTTIPIPIPSNPFPYPPPLPQASQFQYAIYPSTFVYSKSILPTLFVNTTNPFPPDIVFSITLNSPALLVNQTLQLHEIDFRIPIGDPSLRKKVGSDILGGVGLVPVNSSPGSAARMLSNQRWVVHVDVQPTYVNLRVIPRTLNLSVPVGQNTSLSFRLNEVEIAGPTGKNVTSGVVPVFVNFTVTEVYGFYADGDKRTKWVNQGSAFQQMALQRK